MKQLKYARPLAIAALLIVLLALMVLFTSPRRAEFLGQAAKSDQAASPQLADGKAETTTAGCKASQQQRPSSSFRCGGSSASGAPCGEVCEYTTARRVSRPQNPHFVELRKEIECCNIIQRLVESRAATDLEWPPPREIPQDLARAYTQDGQIHVTKFYVAERYAGSLARQWTPQSILDMNASLMSLSGAPVNGQWATYGNAEARKLGAVIREYVPAGSHVLVVGSERPWVEVLALNAGAHRVTTVEYAFINSSDPRIQTWTPAMLGRAFLECPEDFQFDAVVSYSSVEHSGLGRYGDTLNPFGDLEAVAQMWCMLRPGGLLVLGVPIGHFLGDRWAGRYKSWKNVVNFSDCRDCDKIEYNAHRFYGPTRLPHLLSNFELVRFGVLGTQEALVARKVLP
jgi:hypothetical protein